jgi:hypothetical protein
MEIALVTWQRVWHVYDIASKLTLPSYLSYAQKIRYGIYANPWDNQYLVGFSSSVGSSATRWTRDRGNSKSAVQMGLGDGELDLAFLEMPSAIGTEGEGNGSSWTRTSATLLRAEWYILTRRIIGDHAMRALGIGLLALITVFVVLAQVVRCSFKRRR